MLGGNVPGQETRSHRIQSSLIGKTGGERWCWIHLGMLNAPEINAKLHLRASPEL